jgi:hypothetical protein
LLVLGKSLERLEQQVLHLKELADMHAEKRIKTNEWKALTW